MSDYRAAPVAKEVGGMTRTAIMEYLDRSGVPYLVKAHQRPVFTSQDAARERGVRLSQIVKTMLLKSPEGRVLVAVLPGHRRLDLKKLKKCTGHKNLEFMDGDSIRTALGLVVGAIAPVGDLARRFPVFVDAGVFDEEHVDISSGDPTAGLELASRDLRRLLAGAAVADLAR
ncbi:MAG: YbaK/EbsC family protein [Thermodesulfobacteriota bacterium]